jgi:outer membrane murein-binding lipoprotein Lpp
MWRAASALTVLLAGCAGSGDPAEGGFVSGVAGLAGGGYEARIDERETAVATSEARQAELAAELAGLEAEHRALQDRIARQRALLQAAGAPLSPETEARIDAALRADPDPRDPDARAAALRQAIADARRLSEQLAALAS